MKEQKCKNRKKSKIMSVRKTQDLLKRSGFANYVIENICPTQYGERGRTVISFEELVNPDKKSILYLKYIGALQDSADAVLSDVSVTDSSNSDSSDSDEN